MAYTSNDPVQRNKAFLGELECIFKEEFLKAAPLYVASSKIKLPYEDLHRLTPMYSGSLKEVTRIVEQIADIHFFKADPDPEEIIERTTTFAQQSGALVDGLIRMENLRSKVPDFQDVRNMKVIDVFEHSDGRRNAQLFFSAPGELTVSDPAGIGHGFIGYKFVFACAAIVLEYKKQV